MAEFSWQESGGALELLFVSESYHWPLVPMWSSGKKKKKKLNCVSRRKSMHISFMQGNKKDYILSPELFKI